MINIVLELFGVIELVEYLFSLINSLFELIINLIAYITDIFTPDKLNY
jgi:hypothetical protein